jgi:hypothetical protein
MRVDLNGKTIRTIERAAHLIAGTGLLLIVFTPLGDGALGGALRFALVPPLVLSGLLMWQHARVSRVLRRSPRRARQTS